MLLRSLFPLRAVCAVAATCVPLLAKAQPILQAKVTADHPASRDTFGTGVAISGNTAIVGANGDDDAGSSSGSAFIFVAAGTSWHQQAKLTASDARSFDFFGKSVAISGDTAIVGAYGDDIAGVSGCGSAYVYVRTGTAWTEQSRLTATNGAAGDSFGICVAISGNTAVIGANEDDDAGSRSGSAYVFVRADVHGQALWTQQAQLTASDAAAGDSFGLSVAISVDTVVVGAYASSPAGSYSGSAYVFVAQGASWVQQAKLLAPDAVASASFGISAAISGDTALIGAYHDGQAGLEQGGSAYVFVRTGTAWTKQTKLTASDAAAGDSFGMTVAISSNRAVIGSWADDDAGTSSGSAYVFARSGTVWAQQAKITSTDAASNDRFGWKVALSGDTTIIGAQGDNGRSGSAYIYALPAMTDSCTNAAEFTRASDAINAVCCADAAQPLSSPCTSGIITTCSHDCGVAMQPFYTMCHGFLTRNHLDTNVEQALALCNGGGGH